MPTFLGIYWKPWVRNLNFLGKWFSINIWGVFQKIYSNWIYFIYYIILDCYSCIYFWSTWNVTSKRDKLIRISYSQNATENLLAVFISWILLLYLLIHCYMWLQNFLNWNSYYYDAFSLNQHINNISLAIFLWLLLYLMLF